MNTPWFGNGHTTGKNKSPNVLMLSICCHSWFSLRLFLIKNFISFTYLLYWYCSSSLWCFLKHNATKNSEQLLFFIFFFLRQSVSNCSSRYSAIFNFANICFLLLFCVAREDVRGREPKLTDIYLHYVKHNQKLI